ncbi:hypothetical protein BU25DRAFT_486486 [Macroventuria anomochaeta]|uniref:Uncharacterized protein n=1 Tax=Macroventuria anomochaeta TaxID=301207 RepID=A0ACB6SGS8_9PLEO|nr:uncharacterized protein BU25DRAFT_486486 [Macroventuria anomochaeta]KAF2633371.1 hypothetical protein BU25DRAFT_486486 [Macroventuria anomochaeta]
MPFRSVNLGSVRHPGGSFALIKWDKNEVCALPEFENALSIVARHPNIHTLRMLNLPNIQYSSPVNPMSIWKSISDDDAMKCQALMGKFAEEVFRFLANCNSTVQFIDINPLLLPPTPPKWDDNDHQWPLYAYTAHTTSLEGHTISWAKPCKLNFAIKMLR